MQLADHLPEMLTSVIEIDNLDGAGEVQLGQIPDPLGSVAHDDFLLCAAPATIPSFQIDPLAELFGGFDGAHVGGGVRITDGIALLIPLGLSEHTAQLGFPCMGWLALGLAL